MRADGSAEIYVGAFRNVSAYVYNKATRNLNEMWSGDVTQGAFNLALGDTDNDGTVELVWTDTTSITVASLGSPINIKWRNDEPTIFGPSPYQIIGPYTGARRVKSSTTTTEVIFRASVNSSANNGYSRLVGLNSMTGAMVT